MLPEFLTSCSGVGNVTLVKRAGVVSCLAKCLLELELIDGAGVIPKERVRKREAQGLSAVCQGNLQALGLWKSLLCQLSLLVDCTTGREAS